MPPVKLTWYDGGLLPPKPEDLGDERMNPGGGLMYVGTQGQAGAGHLRARRRGCYPVAACGVEDARRRRS